MLRIGYVRRTYGAEATVYGASSPMLSFRRIPAVPLHRATTSPFWRFTTVAAALGTIDLVHLFNDVALVNRPWVATFEDEYPVGRKVRTPWKVARRLAAGSRCRRLLAISENARARLACDAETGPALAHKCEVVYPCVPREDDLFARHRAWLDEHPPGRGPLRLLFVGAQAFGKGLEFVLDALEPLATREPGIRLTIVSPLTTDTYVSRADEGRVRAVVDRLARSTWAERVERLSRREVRERMAAAHLLLFPTLDETFGFVVPEAMATGLDVVTTNVRAIPEILGPLAPRCAVALPLDERSGWRGVRLWRTEGDGAYAAAWADARERCVEGIRARVAAAIAEPTGLASLAPVLRARYEAQFTPESLGERLVAVYRAALHRS